MFMYVLESCRAYGMVAGHGVVVIFYKTHVWYICSIICIICIICDSNGSGTIKNVRNDDDGITS